MVGPLDGLIAWLMRPRVRRVRRWSFVLTVPFALLVGQLFGIEQGVVVIAVRVALWAAVAVVAWRLAGERGEALRDLLMHPRARAFARAEFDVLSALPRLVARRIGGRARPGATYRRGTFGVALGLAFTPLVVAEAVAFHLLLGGGIVAWVQTALHAYSLLWLWGFALGPRAFPHRIGRGAAVLRNGALYRVRVPLSAIATVVARTERVGRGYVERDGAVLLGARDRVDVWLELSEPVGVQRPWREPATTTRLAIACDEPATRPSRPELGRGRATAAAGGRGPRLPAGPENARFVALAVLRTDRRGAGDSPGCRSGRRAFSRRGAGRADR